MILIAILAQLVGRLEAIMREQGKTTDKKVQTTHNVTLYRMYLVKESVYSSDDNVTGENALFGSFSHPVSKSNLST